MLHAGYYTLENIKEDLFFSNLALSIIQGMTKKRVNFLISPYIYIYICTIKIYSNKWGGKYILKPISPKAKDLGTYFKILPHFTILT